MAKYHKIKIINLIYFSNNGGYLVSTARLNEKNNIPNNYEKYGSRR